AFLELLDLALRERGRRAVIDLWPEGEPDPRLDHKAVAHVRVTDEPAEKDPLFAQILARRTNREPYANRGVPDAALSSAAQTALARRRPHLSGAPDPALRRELLGPLERGIAIASCNGGALRAHLRQLAWDGFEKEFRTPAAYMESVNLMRIGPAEIAHERDGL